MKKAKTVNRILSLCLAGFLVLSLAACKGQADGQDSQPPTATITLTEAPTPTPTPTPPIPYTDVPSDAYYYDAVVWAYQKGIASDGATFDPASTCTRGQAVTSLWRAMGSPEPQTTENPISDISPDDWYYKPALWAYENGVTSNTTFNPGNPCTNAEVITILWRANGEPAAAVYNSSVSLANPGQYYTRAVAWADNGGMFVGKDSTIDPAAPCSRADLMVYLYWATEQWTFSEEDKTVQAEYEQIINGAQLYEVHGSGLVHADYIDVDGDGKVELLTLGLNGSDVTAAVYANIDGHAGKACEETFMTYGGDNFFTCMADGQLYLGHNVFSGNLGETYDYYKVESDAITFCEQATEYYREETPETDIAIIQKYADKENLFTISYSSASVSAKGLLNPSAVMQKIYAAVLNGDFSFFAGIYGGVSSLVLDENGVVTGGFNHYTTNQKPISVTVNDGVIHCVIKPTEKQLIEYDGLQLTIYSGEFYDICPIGVEYEGRDMYEKPLSSDRIRIMYTMLGGTAGGNVDQYYKVS